MVLGLVPTGQGEMVPMEFCQQMLLIWTSPAWKAGGEVCRKSRTRFLLPLPQCQLLLLFCIKKDCSVPVCPIASEVPEILLALQEQVFAYIVTMVHDCMSKCLPCPVCKGKAPPPAFQPAGQLRAARALGWG